MKIYARWGLAVFAGFGLAAVTLAADANNPMPGQAYYGQSYYGPSCGPQGCYGPMNAGCGSCGQAYGWPPPGSQPFGGWQGPPPDCGGGAGRCGLFRRRFGGQGGGFGGDGGNGQVPTTAAFPTHPFARSPRDYFMMDQPCMGDRPGP
jgi:hypothetical protein